MLDLYRKGFHCPIVATSVTTAELIKQTANAFLATKISFINMVSDLCEELGVDVATVARGVGLDPRIGSHFLNAGLGFGGSCLPKDLNALITVAEDNGVDVAMPSASGVWGVTSGRSSAATMMPAMIQNPRPTADRSRRCMLNAAAPSRPRPRMQTAPR